MSISSLSTTTANLAAAIPPDGTDQSVQIAVLKKALDASSQNALTLLNALPQPQRLLSELCASLRTQPSLAVRRFLPRVVLLTVLVPDRRDFPDSLG